MKIALVGAEIEENLALRYIASSLEKAGHRTFCLDFHEYRQLNQVVTFIVDRDIDLVGLSMIFTTRSNEFLELARACRKAGFQGHITAGGHFASIHARKLLEDCSAVDSVIHGDGEEPMVELAERLDGFDEIEGLTYRAADGSICRTPKRRNLDDIDSRPWPKRPERFHRYLGKSIANLLSSRGCWASCAFCSIRAFHELNGGKRFRQRSVASVADEMAHLYHDRGVRIFNFQDDNFFFRSASKNLDRFGELKQALEDRKVGDIAIQAKGRPDCIDEKVIKLLVSMGLFRLFLGIETDSPVGLVTLGRGMKLEDNHRALDILRRNRIHTCFNLLIFDPQSTINTIRKNVDFMRRQNWFSLNFCRTEIYGGTPLETRLSAEGRLMGDYRGYTYKIADPRSQRAYEMFRKVFWPRNFAFEGTHFGSMRLDYNFHLLERFSPEQITSELEFAVKSAIFALNRHSAELMDQLLDFASSDQFKDDQAADELLQKLNAERSDFDAAMSQRIAELIDEIEDRAKPRPGRRRFLQTAGATAAAAALAACHRTHMCEAPPPPPDEPPPPDNTHMCEAPPPPEPQPHLTQAQIEQARQILQGMVDSALLPRSAGQYPQDHRFRIQLMVDNGGYLHSCTGLGGSDPIADQLNELIRASDPRPGVTLERPFYQWPYPVEIDLEWFPSRIQGQGQGQGGNLPPNPPDDTHMCEMAPPDEWKS